MTALLRIALALLALLMVAGVASAQTTNDPCPECDPDGSASSSSYQSVDVGVVTDHVEAIADTDTSFSDEENDTFFAWLSICLSVFIEQMEALLGVESGFDADAHADLYASDEGVDLDAGVANDGETVWDFDDSPVGDLDGATWEASSKVRGATGADLEGGVGGSTPDADVDVCLTVTC